MKVSDLKKCLNLVHEETEIVLEIIERDIIAIDTNKQIVFADIVELRDGLFIIHGVEGN